MPNIKLPHALTVHATWISHAAIAAGVIYLYWTGKIDSTALAATLATLGAFWSGVGGALVTAKRSGAVTSPASTTGAPSASPTPATPTAGAVKTDL